MADPIILFNNSTGSDTAASGAGPSTALTGTGASTAASTSVDLSADSPDLSGVATDGSAILWVKSSSGRQAAKITAVNNGTKVVTVEAAYANTESGKTWAIGGKRSTINHADSRQMFKDARTGWTYRLEETGTNYTITSSNIQLGTASVGQIVVYIDSVSATKPIVEQQANDACWTMPSNGIGWVRFKGLRFINTNGTKTIAYVFGWHDGFLQVTAVDCYFGSATSGNRLQGCFAKWSGSTASTPVFIDCRIENNVGNGAGTVSDNNGVECYGCEILNCGSHGIGTGANGAIVIIAIGCIIRGCGGQGIFWNGAGAGGGKCVVINCTIHGNTGSGINTTGDGTRSADLYGFGNTITGNGGYGFNAVAAQDAYKQYWDYNNYGTGATANTSGDTNNLTKGPNDLNVDPQYTNASGGDFSVGANLKAKGFPGSTRTLGANAGATTSYVDIGAVQEQDSGGGGGTTILTRRELMLWHETER